MPATFPRNVTKGNGSWKTHTTMWL